MSIVALIDGDVLSFRSAAAAEERSIKAIHKKSGRSKIFKHRTEFKEFLAEKGLEYDEEKYDIEDIQDAQPEAYCYHTIKRQVESIQKSLDAEFVEIFVGGEGNFREKLELPSKYKGQRAESLRPVLLDGAKQYILKKYHSNLITGKEADDALHIRAYELLASGHDPIIATIDKDARQGSGLKIFNWTVEEPVVEDIPYLGDLRHNHIKKKIEGEGILFLCFQMLFGDPVDHYKPSELSSKKYGQMAAYKALKDAENAPKAFDIVEATYKDWYPSPVTYTAWDGSVHTKSWQEILDLYFKCVYMLRCEDDTTTFWSFRSEFE